MPFNPVNFAVEPPKQDLNLNLGLPEMETTDPREYSAQLLEGASDQDLMEASKIAQDPDHVARLVDQAQADAASGQTAFNMSGSEVAVLAAMALAPIIGGLINKEDGALAGLAASGAGLAKYGDVTAKQQAYQQKS